MLRRSLLHCTPLYVAVLALVGISLLPSALHAVSSGTTTVRISSDDIARIPAISPVSRIDYGAFSILELSKQDLAAIKSAHVRISEEKTSSFIRLRGREINVTSPRKTPTVVSSSSPGMYLIHLAGPARQDWTKELEAAGIKIISYIPDDSYLVWADPAAASSLSMRSFVRWNDSYTPARKIAPALLRASGSLSIAVTIYGDPDRLTIGSITGLGATLIRTSDSSSASGALITTAVFSADADAVLKIAQMPRVVYIDFAKLTVKMDDEVVCQIAAHNLSGANVPLTSPSYQSWLSGLGYNGSGVKIAIVDTGLDTNLNSTCHLDMRGRISNRRIYPGTYTVDVSGHGTHVAGIAAGNGAIGTTDSAGFLYGQGIAPASSLDIQNAAATIGYFPPVSWETLTHDASRDGALVSNNSWSLSPDVNVGYTFDSATFDSLVRDADASIAGLQPLTIVFSAGNAGPAPSTIGEPKEAKNIIVVGASQNYRPDNPLGSFCGSSGDIQGVAELSSRGPCADGRLAPTLVAPGTDVASAASYYADYNGSLCEVPITADYTWMSGTSMAAPVVSGAAAIIGQWWKATHFGQNPSPAMLKAILVNGADDLHGGPDGRGGTLGYIPNNDQGWGRINIANSVNPPDTCYEDQAHIFTDSGQIYRYRVETADPGKPLKITLAWTDAPGLAGSDAWVNDLDLTATTGTDAYLGNVFSGGFSSANGGVRDSKNNVECIYIQNPSGVYTISVVAAKIAGDAIYGNSSSADQDFALVIRNGRVGGTTLVPYTPVSTSVPAAPDHYAATQAPGGWSAIAVKPVTTGNSNVTLYTDAGYAAVAASSPGGTGLDIIAVDGNRSTPLQLYPLVTTASGSVGYGLEWATRTADLVPGIADTRSFTDSDLIRMWDFSVPATTTLGLQVTPTSGSPDLGVSIFGSTAGQPSTYYRTKSQALFHDDPAGPGSTHTMLVQLPAGRYGAAVWNNGGAGSFSIKLDLTPPTMPIITPASDYTANLTTLAASWSASDPESGIAKYEYAIGSSAGGTDILPWTDAGLVTSVQRTDLTLAADVSYYFSVRVTNGFGMISSASSTPILAVAPIAKIATAKGLSDGHYIQLTGKNISAVYSGRFYIEEADRSSGISVDWNGQVPEGAVATVIGRIMTDVGERTIQGLQVTTN